MDEDFFPNTSQIVRDNMEEKINRELPDDSDDINGAWFATKNDEDDDDGDCDEE